MRTIRNIGEIVEKRDASVRIIQNMVTRKENILNLTQSLSKPRVFFQVGDVPIITVGRGTLANDLIRLAGGENISEDEPVNYPLYSIETVMLKAPEVIIISSMESKRDCMSLIKKWQDWKNIPAIKRKSIYVIDSNLVDRPTPRIIEGLKAMVKMIHTESFGEKR
jgi:iron complex transport system substrate-binding protein